MPTLALAVVLVVIAILAFVASIRVGILLGRGIDQFVEARHEASADASAEDGPQGSVDTQPPAAREASTPGGPTSE